MFQVRMHAIVVIATVVALGEWGKVSAAQEKQEEQPNKYTIRAVKVEKGPKLDGVLDDEVWARADSITGFTQFDPNAGAPSTQRTVVRILYDDRNLYIGAMCYDTEPEKVVGRETRRDADIFQTDDTFAVSIATFPDMNDTYFFNTNPLGALRDAFAGRHGETFDANWDGIWRSAGKRHAQGWSVEECFPFKTFRFPEAKSQTWGINFRRQVRRTRETSYWVPVAQADNYNGFYKFDKGGRLSGLEDLKPGRALEVLPYTVLGSQGNRQFPTGATHPEQSRIGFDLKRDVGGNVKWGITPDITADATIRPDFAQIEADREVVNLSRFEFRFQEKRPFFLEGVDIFKFGEGQSSSGMVGFAQAPTPLTLFFSRRIGILSDGSSVPINFAAKLSGKTGHTYIGYLNAQTGAGGTSTIVPKTNWQAFRLRREVGSHSSIGVIGLFKEPGETGFGFANALTGANAYNRVVGVDGSLAFSKSQHRLEALLARNWLPRTEQVNRITSDVGPGQVNQTGKDWAGSVVHKWRSNPINMTTIYADVRAGFFADMGFVTRRDFRRLSYVANSQKLIRQAGVRRLQSSLLFDYIATHDHSFFRDPESWTATLSPGIEMENGMVPFGSWSRQGDTLRRDRQIAGVHFPIGSYQFDQYAMGFYTDQGKRLSWNVQYKWGDFYDGTLRNVQVSTTYKPINQLRFQLDTEQNRLRRPPGGITSTSLPFSYDQRFITRFRVNYSFTKEMFVSSFIQANVGKKRASDSSSFNSVVSNLLFAYFLQTGHSFLVAWNQVSDDDFSRIGMTPLDNTPLRLSGSVIVAKFQYLLDI